jgi:hypothetical protein
MEANLTKQDLKDGATYDVAVVRKTKIGALYLRPGQAAQVKGSAIKADPASFSVIKEIEG